MNAAVDGGFKLVEFTPTTPGCLDSVSEYASRKDVLTGVGTVMTVDDAKRALDAGAQFIVSPVLIPEVVEWCAANKIVCAPGCQTLRKWSKPGSSVRLSKSFSQVSQAALLGLGAVSGWRCQCYASTRLLALR